MIGLGVIKTVYSGTRLIGFINASWMVKIYRVEGNKRCKLRITLSGSNRKLTYLTTKSASSLGDEWKEICKEYKFLSSKNLIYDDNI
jgi:hypothetical protein